MTNEAPRWFKSSYSDNGGDCVEVAANLVRVSPRWVTSSYSENGGQCVQVATNLTGTVPVRDSKNPGGPVLGFQASAFAAFVAEIKGGAL